MQYNRIKLRLPKELNVKCWKFVRTFFIYAFKFFRWAYWEDKTRHHHTLSDQESNWLLDWPFFAGTAPDWSSRSLCVWQNCIGRPYSRLLQCVHVALHMQYCTPCWSIVCSSAAGERRELISDSWDFGPKVKARRLCHLHSTLACVGVTVRHSRIRAGGEIQVLWDLSVRAELSEESLQRGACREGRGLDFLQELQHRNCTICQVIHFSEPVTDLICLL